MFGADWSDEQIEIIADDLEVSDQSLEGRVGFQRLLAEISLGHVGIVLGIEMSRLTRTLSPRPSHSMDAEESPRIYLLNKSCQTISYSGKLSPNGACYRRLTSGARKVAAPIATCFSHTSCNERKSV